MKATPARKPPETVCFRLAASYRDELAAQAAAADISPGEYARRIVIAYLEDAERERLREQMLSLRSEIGLFRDDFSTLAEVLLVLASGGSVGPVEAQTWVQERLRDVQQNSGIEGRIGSSSSSDTPGSYGSYGPPDTDAYGRSGRK